MMYDKMMKSNQFNLNDILLVTGAGAHVPYGFPTGAQLRRDIINLEEGSYSSQSYRVIDYSHEELKLREQFNSVCELILDKDHFFEGVPQDSVNYKESYLTKEIRKFAQIFRESQNPSIDSYLSTFTNKNEVLPDYKFHVEIGKAIIEGILSYYYNSILIGKEYNWIQYLFKSHFDKWEHVEYSMTNPLNIITFNYDIYFESCIKEYLKHNYIKNYRKIDERLVNIFHSYGSLNGDEEIRVIGEDRESSLEETSLKLGELIENVKKVYFLGFGFDEINLDLLFSKVCDKKLQNISFYSTNIGLNKFKINDIYKKINNKFTIEFYEKQLNAIDCLKLIEEIEPLTNNVSKDLIHVF